MVIDFLSYKKARERVKEETVEDVEDEVIEKVENVPTKLYCNPAYKLASNCRRCRETYGICLKCGACGRRFDSSGILID